MRYYIRHDKEAKVEGPFTVAALIDAIQAGQIPKDALASSDLGEDIANLQAWRSCDWFPVAAIAELRQIIPQSPEPLPQPRRLSVFPVIGYLVVALGFSCSAVAERRWFAGVLAVLATVCAIDAIIRYARQRKDCNPAV